jgi:hypothetical protein
MIECNSIPWASGNTGLVRWNTRGFESISGEGEVPLELTFSEHAAEVRDVR